MPEITAYYNLVMKLRRHPSLHGPLRKVKRLIADDLPALLVDLLRVLAPERALTFGPPKGTFSIFQSLQCEGRRPGRVVLTDQGVPEVSPESLLVISNMQQHTCQPWPVFWSHHRKARLVASTLALLDERKRLCREAAYGDICLREDPAWRYATLPDPVVLAGNWTSLVSRWCPNDRVPPFSHWIQDSLPRLALLPDFPPDTGILVQGRLAAYQKETLKLLGLLDRVRYTPERHVVVENYWFSSPVGIIAGWNPYAVNWLRSAFLPLADQSYCGPKRFIIQRKGKTRGIVNEAEVNAFFEKLGWGIIDTEQLTFAQEIELFARAEAFAGLFGSGFTNAIWSSPGCKVITFVPDAFVDGGIEAICVANQLDYHWRIFPSDHEMMATLDLGEVRKLLDAAGLIAN
jgi:hypothetical protein